MKVVRELAWRHAMLSLERVGRVMWLCNLRRPWRLYSWVARRWVKAAQERRRVS